MQKIRLAYDKILRRSDLFIRKLLFISHKLHIVVFISQIAVSAE